MASTITTTIAGICPACGQQDLILLEARVTCGNGDCPRPTAVHELLSSATTDHLVDLQPSSFDVQHPLIERLDSGLFDCWLAGEVFAHGKDLLRRHELEPGMYWARTRGAGADRSIEWEPIA